MGLFDEVPEEVIWAILVGVIVYLVKIIWFPPPPPIVAKKKLPTYEKRDYSLEELKKYTGTNETPIFLSIKGKIYDVSYKRSMYGPGGDYSLFAGHDATTCLAKSSFENSDLNRSIDTSSFNADELDSLNNWVSFFDDRYDTVGYVTDYKTSSSKSSSTESSTSIPTTTPTSSTTSTSSSASKSSDELRTFTFEELLQYNGGNGKEIYVSVNGKVFDVSSKPEFYGPGKSYNLFAGHDATTCLGKNNLTKESLDKLDTSDFTQDQKANLEKWVKVYESKYPLVGTLKI